MEADPRRVRSPSCGSGHLGLMRVQVHHISHTRDPEHAKQKAHDGRQRANSILKPDNLGTKLVGIRVENIESDHVRHSPPYPTPCRRTRHSQTLGDARVPGVVGEFTQAMVVRAAAGGFSHPGRMDGGQRRRKAGRRSRRQDTPKGQQFCTRCICTHETPGCRDPQLGCQGWSRLGCAGRRA